jgi:hypothetical protein
MNYLTLIPAIFQIVKMIEELMPESKGKEKFDAAVATVASTYGTIAPAVPTLINNAVTLLNLAGTFKKQ